MKRAWVKLHVRFFLQADSSDSAYKKNILPHSSQLREILCHTINRHYLKV